MLVQLVPVWMQNFGNELGAAWPFFTFIALVAGILYKLIKRAFKNELDHRIDMSVKDSMDKHVKPAVDDAIKPIKEQFETNGGKSMKDAINRVEAAQASQAQTLKEHTDSDTRNFEQITDMMGMLTELMSKK